MSKKGRSKSKKVKQQKQPKTSGFGPVSAISTAPVAIGNSIRGSKPVVVNSVNGCRITGRDFAFSLGATAASVTGWELIGGMPVAPAVLPGSLLKNYCQMFARFKVNRLAFHYITASPTSQAGDVLFYYERDRKAPMCDYSSAAFLPFVLSDSSTVIGPQWTNHTLTVEPVKEWKSNLFGMNSDIDEDAAGTVFLFSKTNSTNSPGYILVDYDISFKEMAVNPRAGSLPIARGQSNVISLGHMGQAITAGSSNLDTLVIRGVGLNGLATTMPSGAMSGDVYKGVVNATSSTTLNTWTNVTLTNLVVAPEAQDVTVIIDDGFTFYISYADNVRGGGDNPTLTIYPTLEQAISRSNPYKYGVTATVTWALIVTVQLVSNTSGLTQSAY